MNRRIVTLNDITNGLININIMEVKSLIPKNGHILVPSEYWCVDSRMHFEQMSHESFNYLDPWFLQGLENQEK